VEGHCWHEPSGKQKLTGDLSFLVCLSPPRSSSWFTHYPLYAGWGWPPEATSLSVPWPPYTCYEESCAGLVCMHVVAPILSRWNPPSGMVEMATMISALVLLCKMRCTFFFTVKTCLCALSGRIRSFFSLFANPFLSPLCFACLAWSDYLYCPFSMAQQTLPFHFRHYGHSFG